MKKILFLFPPMEKFSTQNYYFRVQQEVSILKSNYDLDFISFDEINKLKRAFLYFRQFPRIIFVIWQNDIIFMFPSPLLYIFVPIAKFFRKKIILDHYTTSVYNFELSPYVYRFFFKLMDWFSYQVIDIVITHTETMKKLICDFYKLTPNIVYVIYSCVDTTLFKSTKKDWRLLKKLGLNNSQKTVLYTGLFHQFHGTEIIIQAARLVEKSNIKFLIIGRKINSELKNIVSLGVVPYGELPKYLNLGDLWVGSVGDGIQGDRALSSNMIAAMAVGVPVLVGKWPEIDKFIKNQENGFIIERNNPKVLADTICSILAGNKLKQVRKKSRQTVRKYNSMAEMTKKINGLMSAL